MIHRSTTTQRARLTAVWATFAVLAWSTSAAAFSIDSVSVLPEGTITSQDPVLLEVLITTLSAPVWLTQPTEVVVAANEVFVDMFADCGYIRDEDTLLESVDLGTFQPDTYVYTVTLDPAFGGDYWDSLVATGSFTVVPEPATMALLALGGVAVLGRRRP